MSKNRKQRRSEKSLHRKVGTSRAFQGIFDDALRHHQAGRLAEAEQLYLQVLALDTRHADSLHLLGVLAHQVGSHEVAIDLIGQAIAVRDDDSLYHFNLANALRDQGRADKAVASYRRALGLKSDFADALINLGIVLKSQDKPDEAATCYEHALKLRPDSAETHNNLGNILKAQGKLDDAASHFMHSIALNPGFTEAHYNLGNVLKAQDKLDDATASYERAIALNPGNIDAHLNLGHTFMEQRQFDKAEQCFRYLLELNPDDPELINQVGCALLHQQKLEEAITYFDRALALMPNGTGILNNMATALKAQGRLDEAIAYLREAIRLEPGSNFSYSNLLLAMVYAASVPPQELAATARQFGRHIANPLRRQRPLSRDCNPDRRLRIGYVSPNLRDHALTYFFEPLLKLHDRKQFEVFAYSNTRFEDEITTRFKQAFDHWRDIRLLTDDRTADVIEADQIDILVDLAGHTGDNRLLVFARKPASIQVTWLGYPATTGMVAMDYRITDIHAEPVGTTEHLNVEELWRMPEIFCCYQAHGNSPAVIDHPPFEGNGYVTFGCFNNFSKVTDPVLETWGRILAQVPESRLLLEVAGLEGSHFRTCIEQRLRHANLPFERVILEPRKRSNQFVLYNRIDIALDPFPCAGGTTSMDTMWMGVPLVTLAGDHFVSRMGVTILTNAGMPELIAGNTDQYVRLATSLALDKDRLRSLRHNLRDKVAASPLMNQVAFTRNMEAAYRGMWRRWCAGG